MLNPERGVESKAKTLAGYIGRLPGFRIEPENPLYDHMGATITDAMLQPGLTWKTTVEPRVQKVKKYPNARTTSGFLELLRTEGIMNLLEWNDPEKPNRIHGVTQFFKDSGIETESDLKEWFGKPGNDTKLLKLRGIGPKTLNYFKGLAGISGCAIDRHLREFVRSAGVIISSDEEAKSIVDTAADLKGLNRSVLDYSIWHYMSQRN